MSYQPKIDCVSNSFSFFLPTVTDSGNCSNPPFLAFLWYNYLSRYEGSPAGDIANGGPEWPLRSNCHATLAWLWFDYCLTKERAWVSLLAGEFWETVVLSPQHAFKPKFPQRKMWNREKWQEHSEYKKVAKKKDRSLPEGEESYLTTGHSYSWVPIDPILEFSEIHSTCLLRSLSGYWN
jgi:hypothetical protein